MVTKPIESIFKDQNLQFYGKNKYLLLEVINP